MHFHKYGTSLPDQQNINLLIYKPSNPQYIY